MEFQYWLFDKRIVRRNIRKNLITRQDYLKYIEDLEDVADFATTMDEGENEESTSEATSEENAEETSEVPVDESLEEQLQPIEVEPFDQPPLSEPEHE